jgi:hypothetical protein
MLLVVLILAGCATPFRAPPDMSNIKLVRVDSPVVIVENRRLTQNCVGLARGYDSMCLAKGYISAPAWGPSVLGGVAFVHSYPVIGNRLMGLHRVA